VSFSRKILIGLAGGILTGVFLGERAAVLKWAADGFVKLLQMMVLPYITVSIVASLGGMELHKARTLGWRIAAVLAGLWAVALLFAFSLPLMFPPIENASFFSTSLLDQPPDFNFIDLYIPANPFHSLANNIVPAVVLFSLILGTSLIGIQHKNRVVDLLGVLRDAITTAMRFVTRLTPYGLFAIAATAAGTLSFEQLSRLQVFLVAYVVVGFLVSFLVLPGLVSALTPIRARDFLKEAHAALITAAVAGDLFIVLPMLTQSCRTLVERITPQDADAAKLPDVVVPTSFNFPHSGKLLSLSFVLFAGWFSDAPVPRSEYPALALSGLVSFFGSLNAAVPFLLDLFRIPADTFQLFLATAVINSRVGSLVAAAHTLTVAVLVTCAMTGHLHFRRRRVVSYALVTAAAAIVAIGGTRWILLNHLSPEYSKDEVLASMHLLHQPVAAAVLREPDVRSAEDRAPLDAIAARGALRVGYVADSLPFAFFNRRGDLVGFDIELAHRLAAELGVGLVLVPVDREKMAEQLDSGYCDIVMSGVALTTARAAQLLFSDSYLDETVALIVPDHQRERYRSWDAIRELGPITIAVPNLPYYLVKLTELLPNATLQRHGHIDALFERAASHVDAIALPAERGSAWTLIYPQFSVVVPSPQPIRVPLAYPLAKHDEQFASFINSWIALKRKDGTFDAAFNYWILGRDAAPRHPRWSILRDVLHWDR
jgi:Na+/H+-dicarboxylate symporter